MCFIKKGFENFNFESPELFEVNPEPQAFFGISPDWDSPEQGVRIGEVIEKSAAEEMDIQVGDVILRFNDKRIENDSHLVNEVNMVKLGQTVPMMIFRDGATRTLKVVIRSRN